MKAAIAHANNWSLILAFHIIFTQAPVDFTWVQAQVCPGIATPLTKLTPRLNKAIFGCISVVCRWVCVHWDELKPHMDTETHCVCFHKGSIRVKWHFWPYWEYHWKSEKSSCYTFSSTQQSQCMIWSAKMLVATCHGDLSVTWVNVFAIL